MSEERLFLSASELHEITGLSVRYFHRLAAEKKIDWAHQPEGPRTAVRFNRAGFEQWWNCGKPTTWQKSSKGATRTTVASPTAAENTGGPLKQRLLALRSNGWSNLSQMLKTANGDKPPDENSRKLLRSS